MRRGILLWHWTLALAPLPLSALYCTFSIYSAVYLGLGLAWYGAGLTMLAARGGLVWWNCALYPLMAFWLAFLWLFDCAPNLGVVLNFTKTSWPEIGAWIKNQAMLNTLVFAGWMFTLWSAFSVRLPRWPLRRTIRYGLLGLGLVSACAAVYFNDVSKLHQNNPDNTLFGSATLDEFTLVNETFWPLGPFNLARQALTAANTNASADPALAPGRPPPDQAIATKHGDGGLTVVFVIGESQRADWMSPSQQAQLLPELHARWKDARLIELSKLWSVSNLTMYAMPALMTGVAPPEMMEGVRARPSGLGYLKQAGFFTAFVSNNTMMGFAENGWDYAKGSDGLEWFDQHLALELKRLLATQATKRAFVFQLIGSHFHYPDRFPQSFRQQVRASVTQAFATAVHAPLRAREAQAVQDYLTSIAYSGQVLDQMLRQLDQLSQPAVLIFCSDHGENLYDDERRYYWHGGYARPALPELRPAAFVAWNTAYGRQFQPELAHLRRLAPQPLQQQNILPLWLRLAGLQSPRLKAQGDDPFEADWRAQPPGTQQFYISGKLMSFKQLK